MTGICEKCGASFIEQHCPGCPNDPKNKKEPEYIATNESTSQ